MTEYLCGFKASERPQWLNDLTIKRKRNVTNVWVRNITVCSIFKSLKKLTQNHASHDENISTKREHFRMKIIHKVGKSSYEITLYKKERNKLLVGK